ncbi:MAG TPA: FecR domain-containing protein [Planctomycetota bacterium]|nr:FecR domain-containing protein [Planctomycetota bacterium]
MNMPADRDEELRGLLRRLSDGPLSPEEAARLNELLHGNPELCELYLNQFTLEGQLRHEFGGRQPGHETLPSLARPDDGPRSIPARRATGGQVVRFAAAALLGAGLTMLASSVWSRPRIETARQEEERSTSDCMATLLFADDCQWRSEVRLVEGQRLAAGPLHLERGLAILRFDGGAAVVLEGPAELEVESRGCARLTAGRVTVRAPQEAAGFTVRSPASDVVDLGTEFAVVVERGGATEVHVLEGEVSYGKAGASQDSIELLGAGNAVRYDGAKASVPRAVPLKSPRFAELLNQAKLGPREDLLLAYEGFNYPVGRLPLAQAKGGIGWAGPWSVSPGVKLSPGGTGDLTIASGMLHVPWPVQGGRGPMLEAAPEYQSRRRQLAEPVRLDEDGVYYVSVIVRWDAPPPPPTGQTMPAVRLVLRSSTDFNGDHVMFNLPVFQQPQLDIQTGAIFTSSQTVARNETQFWVGKIVARRQGEDEIFFRVYGEGEPLPMIEPASWSVKSRGVRSDARLDLVLLTKMDGGMCWWDEVRIGKSWRAVVPTSAFAGNPK